MAEEKQEKLPERRPSRKRLWIGLAVLAVAVIVTVLACTLTLLLHNPSNSSSGSGSGLPGLTTHPDSNKPFWPGWSGINHLAVFGDSMTSVNFVVDGEQPSRANPIGNPDFPGLTSAIGPNWVGFLTGTYNTSFIQTIDLGGGGATVDADIFSSNYATERSFEDQVLTDWLPKYAKPKTSDFQWTSKDTLFAIYFGLNDVRDAYFQNLTSLNNVVERYVALMGDLYRNGARNFLVLLLPSFQNAPMLNPNDSEGIREVKDLVQGYNANLSQALSQFNKEYSDASIFPFDYYSLFDELLNNPCSYDETCPIQDTTTYCPAYASEREDMYRDDPSCAYPVDKYFWINGLHIM